MNGDTKNANQKLDEIKELIVKAKDAKCHQDVDLSGKFKQIETDTVKIEKDIKHSEEDIVNLQK